jgi:hypothetical protein
MGNIEHKAAKVRSMYPLGEWEPTRDDEALAWLDNHYLNSLRIAAAAASLSLGTPEKTANLLWLTGYKVPAGYFDEDDPEYLDAAMDEETELRRWLERDQEVILRISETEAFRLSVDGYQY